LPLSSSKKVVYRSHVQSTQHLGLIARALEGAKVDNGR
jgi:hypothetical protein